MSKAIRQLKNRDGAIGLEGKWGTGKSTVINLAEEKLEDDSGDCIYSVFTFDLWSHQTDDFRRAFLEDFVTWLEGKKFIKPKEAKRQRNKIRDRVKRISTVNTKSFTLFAFLRVC